MYVQLYILYIYCMYVQLLYHFTTKLLHTSIHYTTKNSTRKAACKMQSDYQLQLSKKCRCSGVEARGTKWKFTKTAVVNQMFGATFQLCTHNCCRGRVIVSSWDSLSDLVSFPHSDPLVLLGTKEGLYHKIRYISGFVQNLLISPHVYLCRRILLRSGCELS